MPTSQWYKGDLPVTQRWHPGPGAYEPGHTGIDIGMPEGTPIFAPFAGTVKDLTNPGGFGTYEEFTPDSNSGIHIILGHLSKWLASGHVSAGQEIALSGSTGWSTGPHLHFQENTGGTDVNPSDILFGKGGVPPSTTGQGSGGNPLDIAGAITGLPQAISDQVKNTENAFMTFSVGVGLFILALVLILVGLYMVSRNGESDSGGGIKVVPIPV